MTYPDYAKFSQWLKESVEARAGRMDDKTLAESIHTGTTTFSAWMTGKSKFNKSAAHLIAFVYGLNWQYICETAYEYTGDKSWLN